MIKPMILVVEDERLIARDIAMQLNNLGYTALGPASTGEQAIEMIEKLRPQLVLMDIHLASAMDGVTAAEIIRNRFEIPAVFLSAFDDVDSHERAMQARPVGYIAKPFSEYDLRTVVQSALAAL